MIKFKEKVLLAKLETSYGTDASPTAAANAILAKDVELTPLEAESIERGLVKPHLGAEASITSGAHVSISFKVENQSSGTAGTAPAFGELLRAAGMAEVVTPTTMVEYNPVSEGFESASIYFYLGTNLHKLLGALGSCKPILEKGIPYLEFNFIGLWADPTNVAKPVANWSAFQKPTVTGKGRTSGFSLLGYAAIPHSLSLDIGQEVKYIETLTDERVDITGRKATGSVTIEAPAVSDHNYFLDVKNDTTGVLSIQHGQTAGKIVKIDCPSVQLASPKYGDADGVATLELSLTLLPTAAGNDEIKLTYL